MPNQLLKPADVEQAVIDELTMYEVSTSIPETKPSIFVRVVATGGTSRDLVTDEATIVLEVFGVLESAARAASADALARLELAARQNRLGNEVCYRMQVAALPQNYPLPSVPSHKRYITTITAAVRRGVTTI
jgi:hypothetical protein